MTVDFTTVVWEKFNVKIFSSLMRQLRRKLNAQNHFNNEQKNKGTIFDLVLNQIVVTVYLVCTKPSCPTFES